jgi:hypothetical protein
MIILPTNCFGLDLVVPSDQPPLCFQNIIRQPFYTAVPFCAYPSVVVAALRPPPLWVCVPPSSPAPVPTPISKLTVKLSSKVVRHSLNWDFWAPGWKQRPLPLTWLLFTNLYILVQLILFFPPSDNHLFCCIVRIVTSVSDDFCRDLPLRIEICWNKRILLFIYLFMFT